MNTTIQAELGSALEEDFAHALARFASQVSVDKLPPEVIEAAQANVFDTLACAVAGSSALGIREIRELVTLWGGAPQAHSLVFGDAIPAHLAAWINGAMSHARDYDDTHDAAVLHAGVSVVPAALAAAELAGGASGADFLAGVVVGLETISRLGIATTIGIVESGFMYSPLFGHFAATLAAARVLRLDEATTVNALGIAYSQVAGNHQVTRDAALTKRMQPGFAAMSALISVQLAQKGVRGAQNTFEGQDGFLRVYLHDRCDREKLRSGLGEKFEFVQLSYKPYPNCRFNHAAIGAALALKAKHQIAGDQVRSVKVGVNHQAYQAVCTPDHIRKNPQTVVQAQFSIPYTVAAALTDGGVYLGHFAPTSFERADIMALASKVDGYVNADIEKNSGRGVTPALVEIEMLDGVKHVMQIDFPLGHPSNPMTPQDFVNKASDCFDMAQVPLKKGGSAELKKLVDGIVQMKDTRELLGVVCSAGS